MHAAVGVHHAVLRVGGHAGGADLVQAVPRLADNRSGARVFRHGIVNRADAGLCHRFGEDGVRLQHAVGVGSGIVEVDRHARHAQCVHVRRQAHPVVRRRCLFAMIVKRVAALAVLQEHRWPLWLLQVHLSEHVERAKAGGNGRPQNVQRVRQDGLFLLAQIEAAQRRVEEPVAQR